MRRTAAAALGVALAPLACAQDPCGSALTGTVRRALDDRYVVAYVTTPDPVTIGTHFVVDMAVCSRDDAAAPADVRVDATMPEHRHGMNYRPTVTARAAGVYRAEGLLFHMPGRWDVSFDVVSGGRVHRLTSTLLVE